MVKMKILYVTQFFYPEITAGAFRAYDNARIWCKKGSSVTVFTSYPNYPIGKFYKGYKIRLFTEELIADIRVIRSKMVVKENKTLFTRILNMSSFLFFGLANFALNGRRIGNNYDIVLGTSGPVFTPLLAWIYAVLHHLTFVLEIRDIGYRQLIATGKSSSNTSVKLMKGFELFLCRRAKHVVVVTEGFKDILVSDGIEKEKITVITNGIEVSSAMERHGTGDALILSYFGTLGISQRIEETFPYAEVLAKCFADFTYQIIGEGAQRKSIEALLEAGNYPFIQLLHGMSQDKLESYYRKTELSVVALAKSEDFRYTLPSKLFQIMGHGIAVLFIGPDGEAAGLVRKYNAGITLCGTVEEDQEELRKFFSRTNWREKLWEMGKNGRDAVIAYYDREVLAKQYLEILRKEKEVTEDGKRDRIRLHRAANDLDVGNTRSKGHRDRLQ